MNYNAVGVTWRMVGAITDIPHAIYILIGGYTIAK